MQNQGSVAAPPAAPVTLEPTANISLARFAHFSKIALSGSLVPRIGKLVGHDNANLLYTRRDFPKYCVKQSCDKFIGRTDSEMSFDNSSLTICQVKESEMPPELPFSHEARTRAREGIPRMSVVNKIRGWSSGSRS